MEQYVQKESEVDLRDIIINQMFADSRFIDILRMLDWNTVSYDEFETHFPESGELLDLMESIDVISREDGKVRIHESIQGLGLDFNDLQTVREVLYFDRGDIKVNLGFTVLYVVDSLISIYFGIEPCWEGDSEKLIKRSGLIDCDDNLTESGKSCVLSLFTSIADLFDTHKVDPEEMLIRWTKHTIRDSTF